MGQTWGYIPESGFNLYFKPEVTPDPHNDPTFDPMLGFPEGRKERGTKGERRRQHPEVVLCRRALEPFRENHLDEHIHKLDDLVMLATDEEMRSAKIPLIDRDFCAHLLLKYQSCRKDNWPFPVFCEHEKHEYLHCRYDDFVIRMKEYERERRLMVRQQKIKQIEGAA